MQHGADDVMIKVLYMAYKRLFADKYQALKAEKNYTDKFCYNLPRLDSEDAMERYRTITERNEQHCLKLKNCKESLKKLSGVWQRLINVLDFPWNNFPLGTFIANYNYLLDNCINARINGQRFLSSFQTDTTQWRSDPQNKQGCKFTKVLFDLHDDLGLLLTQIIPNVNISFSLVDFIGLLGYSKHFDITAIKPSHFVETNDILHPLYEWDRDYRVYLSADSSSGYEYIRHKAECKLHITYDGWCNYSAHYNWEGKSGNWFIIFCVCCFWK